MERWDFVKEVSGFIRESGLIAKSSKVLVALSGGADSVALLLVLLRLGYDCVAAHCNFRLRGDESERDCNFTEALCKRLGIRWHVKVFDVGGYVEKHRVSLEMACRELRYEWFEELRVKEKCDVIAVAHHRDDNVETFFINLMRGSGIAGLSGIKAKNGAIVRPLLCVSRSEILAFLEESGQDYVTDSTNLECDFTRNKIRNLVLPAIRNIFPDCDRAISASICNLDGAFRIFRSAIDEIAMSAIEKRGDGVIAIRKDKISSVADAGTVFHEFLSPYGFNPQQTSDIAESAAIGGRIGALYQGDGYVVEVGRDAINLIPEHVLDDDREFKFKINDIGNLPLKLKVDVVDNRDGFKFERDCRKAYFDASIMDCELTLRHWRDGDSFQPFGMRGRKKLSDYFNDNKFSLYEKRAAWILCHGSDVLWIVGHRAASLFPVTRDSRSIVVVEVENP